jgi:hypothetical protein
MTFYKYYKVPKQRKERLLEHRKPSRVASGRKEMEARSE